MKRTKNTTKRRTRPRERYIPHQGERISTPDGPGRVIEVNRPNGIIGATVRLEDTDLLKSPSGGMKWFACRDIKKLDGPPEIDDGRGARNQALPVFEFVEQSHTEIVVHSAGCKDVKAARLQRKEVWPHHERTVARALAAERQVLDHTGLLEDYKFTVDLCARKAERRARPKATPAPKVNPPDLQGDPADAKKSLQTAQPSGRLRSRRTNPTKGGPMAKTATKGRSKSRAKADPEPESNGKTRMTHEEKVKLVPQVVKRLKAGETFTEIKNDPDMPSSGLRRALADAGYDTKGDKIEDIPDYSELEGKKLAKAVADLREEGKPWYFISLATDASKAELVEVLNENGYGHLAEGRVGSADEEEAEETPKRKRSTKASAKTESTKSTGAKSRRGRAKAAPDEDEEETPAPKRGRGRRRSNP